MQRAGKSPMLSFYICSCYRESPLRPLGWNSDILASRSVLSQSKWTEIDSATSVLAVKAKWLSLSKLQHKNKTCSKHLTLSVSTSEHGGPSGTKPTTLASLLQHSTNKGASWIMLSFKCLLVIPPGPFPSVTSNPYWKRYQPKSRFHGGKNRARSSWKSNSNKKREKLLVCVRHSQKRINKRLTYLTLGHHMVCGWNARPECTND